MSIILLNVNSDSKLKHISTCNILFQCDKSCHKYNTFSRLLSTTFPTIWTANQAGGKFRKKHQQHTPVLNLFTRLLFIIDNVQCWYCLQCHVRCHLYSLLIYFSYLVYTSYKKTVNINIWWYGVDWQIRLVGGLTALLTQFRSYRAFKVKTIL